MKLKKACELIQEDIDDEDIDWDSPLGKAYKLSFEALTRQRDREHITFSGMLMPLAGETPEDSPT